MRNYWKRTFRNSGSDLNMAREMLEITGVNLFNKPSIQKSHASHLAANRYRQKMKDKLSKNETVSEFIARGGKINILPEEK